MEGIKINGRNSGTFTIRGDRSPSCGSRSVRLSDWRDGVCFPFGA